jgi:hypothetical protein
MEPIISFGSLLFKHQMTAIVKPLTASIKLIMVAKQNKSTCYANKLVLMLLPSLSADKGFFKPLNIAID